MQFIIRSLIKKIFLWLLPYYHTIYVQLLRYKRKVNVVFFAMSLPMWRYQHLYELLSKHDKFNVYIVILPCLQYSVEQQQRDVEQLKEYFDSRGIAYFCNQDDAKEYLDRISPNILFYPQPYKGNFSPDVDFTAFYNRLLCCYPYAFWTGIGEWSYNQLYHKIAWKLFYSTELHKREAEQYSSRGSENVAVVGYPTADDFLSYRPRTPHVVGKKRIIWAPHFTIKSGGPLCQSNFLWMADLMVSLVDLYSDEVQFIFKPHPRLFSELCKHPEWGVKRTEEYYRFWTTMETGIFHDLFIESDAMIHDCGSFSVEYHYTENPVMYIAHDIEAQLADKNNLGKMALQQHYIGRSKEDIMSFIENVVIAGSDPMKAERQQFKKDYLLPPNGKSVAENTLNVLVKALC